MDAATQPRQDPRVHALVAAHKGFVVGLANEYRGRGLRREDLLAEGNVGLVEAALRFDESRGTKFITYAAWWVRKRILQALAGQRLVNVSPYQKKLDRLDPSRREPARVRIFGLDQPSRLDGPSVADRLAAPGAGAEAGLLRAEAIGVVRAALARLPVQDRRVLALRFGLDGSGGLTLQESGRLLGVSRERVRQIEARAIEELRRAVMGHYAHGAARRRAAIERGAA